MAESPIFTPPQRARHHQRRPHAPSRRLSGWTLVLLLLASFLATGCPTYEDTYSGTFREVTDASSRNSDALEIDFFRFGDNASAVVRLYKRDPITGDPFGQEQFCAWTSAEDFDEEESKFRLYINKSSTLLPRSQLFGTMLGEDDLDVTLFDERTGQPHDDIEALALERVSDEPNPECNAIEDFAVNVEFPRDPQTGGMQRMPDTSGYEIENPVFAVSWLGVQPASGGTVYAPVNRHTPALMLDDGFGSNFDKNSHALKNDRAVLIPPPPETVRMASGTTTIALGHFVVVDDSLDDRPDSDTSGADQLGDWQFSWDTDSEKLVATTLQRATRPECDSGTNHWGRALLFVEDRLDDLAREMQSQIIGLDQCLDQSDCDDHFFVVDVCADETRVLDIVLGNPNSAGSRAIPEIPLFVTDEYLGDDSIPLPRLNPYHP